MSSGAVGIDLGTTFSAIAHVNKHGVPEILPNAEGDRITPSVILFEDNDVIVGNYAKQAAVVYPEQVVEFIKRYMGDPYFRFTYRGRDYSPEELSSFILSKLKHDAEQRLGRRIDHAVITVPAYFNDIQRRATLRAGEQAGLNVLKLLNEPTAAAFAYGLESAGKKARLLLFDLGGGTFDVTVVDMEDREIAVVATAGDHHLGGKDWDDRIIEHVAEAFREKHGIDPLGDLTSHHDLRAKCVSAKISLSRRPKVNIFHDFDNRVLRVALSRESFEDLTRPLLDRCERLTVQVLEDAGIHPEDIDIVLLAGGSTRMPMVRDMLQRVFGKPPATDINPDECVALGAALTAAIEEARLAGQEAPVDIRTHDVTSHSLGMVVYRDGALYNSRVIPRNTRIPAEETRDDYVTSHDGQPSVDLWLVQGESDQPLDCTVLGHFEFYGIPPRPANQSPLSITFRYNANGIVEVEAMDLSSGQLLPHRLASSRVTLQDIAEGRTPIQVALLVDASGSMYGGRMDEVRAAATRFVDDVLAVAHRQVALLAFPGGVVVRPTQETDRVRRGLESLTPIGSSPLSSALAAAHSLLRPQAGVQRVFVIMSDGRPDDAEASMSEVQKIQTSGAHVITIGVGARADADYLRAMASSPQDYHRCGEPVALVGTFVNLATQISTI